MVAAVVGHPRTVARAMGLLVVAGMLLYAVAGYPQEPARLADAQPVPTCPTLEDCPLPMEIAALLEAAGEYGPGDYPPCVEIRSGGAVCVMGWSALHRPTPATGSARNYSHADTVP